LEEDENIHYESNDDEFGKKIKYGFLSDDMEELKDRHGEISKREMQNSNMKPSKTNDNKFKKTKFDSEYTPEETVRKINSRSCVSKPSKKSEESLKGEMRQNKTSMRIKHRAFINRSKSSYKSS
jgi:hypothetical protein